MVGTEGDEMAVKQAAVQSVKELVDKRFSHPVSQNTTRKR